MSVRKFLIFVELPTGNEKTVQNRSLFRKHRNLRIKIKPLVLDHFSWSSELNLQDCLEHDKVFEQNSWSFHLGMNTSKKSWSSCLNLLS